jgi:cytochrome o ubiquinol oxidase operon protein cyoD
MSKPVQVVVSKHQPGENSLGTYVLGFVSSVVLTLLAYISVYRHLWDRTVLIAVVASLAIAQCLVQLIAFLHLGREAKPRWRLGVFIFMFVTVLIVVFGSIWILDNLNYRMNPDQMNTYLRNQDGL